MKLLSENISSELCSGIISGQTSTLLDPEMAQWHNNSKEASKLNTPADITFMNLDQIEPVVSKESQESLDFKPLFKITPNATRK